VADCVALSCQTVKQLERTKNLDITTLPAITYTKCYAQILFCFNAKRAAF